MAERTKLDPTAGQRFWAKVDTSGECWTWTAYLNACGYGKFRFRGEAWLAHRVAYELLIGPIPGGRSLDHMCHNADRSCPGNEQCKHRACVNPAHLATADHRQNALRSPLIGAKMHCKNGHAFDDSNTSMTSAGSRRCLTCHREHQRYYNSKGAAVS